MPIQEMKHRWRRWVHREELRSAAVFATKQARTDQRIIWSKAFMADLADVYPLRTSNRSRSLVISMDDYAGRIARSREDPVAVYVVASHLKQFVREVLPDIARRIVLVTGDDDVSVPAGALGSAADASALLGDRRLVALFAQNLDTTHEKASAIPIGLDFHTFAVSNAEDWARGGDLLSPDVQERQLLKLRDNALPFGSRDARVFANFKVRNNPDERSRWLDHLADERFAKVRPDLIPRTALWEEMSTCQFIASPPGRGRDCHRTWEALSLGCVPIVQRFRELAPLYEGLPVWEVDGPGDITQAALEEKSKAIGWKLEAGGYDFTKLTMPWWTQYVRSQLRQDACTPQMLP